MRALRAMVPTAGLFLSLSLTAFIGECSYAATTFGTAILFQIGWEISYICGVGVGNDSLESQASISCAPAGPFPRLVIGMNATNFPKSCNTSKFSKNAVKASKRSEYPPKQV